MTHKITAVFLGAALAAFTLPAIGQTATQTPRSEVGQRALNQQQRIGQGVKSGQLTAGETAHLERKEAAVNREVRRDRAAHGGRLTGAEKAKVNRQDNRLSGEIYRDKHNGRTQ
jgi:hypothetical protein